MALRRRRILRAAGLALTGSAAGCLGNGDSSDAGGGTPVGTETTDRGRTTTSTRIGTATTDDGTPATGTQTTGRVSDLGTTREVGGTRITVTDVVVRDSVFAQVSPDSLGVMAGHGDRYVFAWAQTEPDVVDRRGIDLVTDRGRYPAGPHFRNGLREFDDGRYGTDPGPRRGWLAFKLPAPLETASAAVVIGDAAWRIPDRHLRRLGQPKPTFELVSFVVPDAVDPDTPIDVETTFRNTGDRPGTLRAVLTFGWGGFPCCLGPPGKAMEIPPGERATWHQSYGGDGPRTRARATSTSTSIIRGAAPIGRWQ